MTWIALILIQAAYAEPLPVANATPALESRSQEPKPSSAQWIVQKLDEAAAVFSPQDPPQEPITTTNPRYLKAASQVLFQLRKCEEPTVKQACVLLDKRSEYGTALYITCRLWFLLLYAPSSGNQIQSEKDFERYHWPISAREGEPIRYDFPWEHNADGGWVLKKFVWGRESSGHDFQTMRADYSGLTRRKWTTKDHLVEDGTGLANSPGSDAGEATVVQHLRACPGMYDEWCLRQNIQQKIISHFESIRALPPRVVRQGIARFLKLEMSVQRDPDHFKVFALTRFAMDIPVEARRTGHIPSYCGRDHRPLELELWPWKVVEGKFLLIGYGGFSIWRPQYEPLADFDAMLKQYGWRKHAGQN